MRYRTLLVLFVVSLAASAIPAAAADAGGMSALDASWTRAMKANDLEAVVALYAPDAVLWMPGDPEASGQQAVRAAFAGLFGAFTVQDVVLADAHYKTSGTLATSWGHYSLTLAPKAGGAPTTLGGRFSGVAERRGGRWVYIADHASAEPPPPATAR